MPLEENEMSTILQENETTLERLADIAEEAGWNVELQAQQLLLHTPMGLGFHISIDTERKYLNFVTYLPLSHAFGDYLELVNTLNREVFLGGFYADDDNDLIVGYQMMYERGLIVGQFTRVLRRFSSMLDHVVDHYGQEGTVFNFTRPAVADATATSVTLQ